MAKRYGRRRVDGIYEYSDSFEEMKASAVREDEAFLKERLALIGLILGSVITYLYILHCVPDWPKSLRFASILLGGCSSALICVRIAVLLKAMFVIVFNTGVLGAFGYLLWRLL